MATLHIMHERPWRAKTLYLPQVFRRRPVVFNGNFGLKKGLDVSPQQHELAARRVHAHNT
jgi:hypothetical protein